MAPPSAPVVPASVVAARAEMKVDDRTLQYLTSQFEQDVANLLEQSGIPRDKAVKFATACVGYFERVFQANPLYTISKCEGVFRSHLTSAVQCGYNAHCQQQQPQTTEQVNERIRNWPIGRVRTALTEGLSNDLISELESVGVSHLNAAAFAARCVREFKQYLIAYPNWTISYASRLIDTLRSDVVRENCSDETSDEYRLLAPNATLVRLKLECLEDEKNRPDQVEEKPAMPPSASSAPAAPVQDGRWHNPQGEVTWPEFLRQSNEESEETVREPNDTRPPPETNTNADTIH